MQVGASHVMACKPQAGRSAFELAAKLADSRFLEKTPNLPKEIVHQRPKFPLMVEEVQGIGIPANVPQGLSLGKKHLRLKIREKRVERRTGGGEGVAVALDEDRTLCHRNKTLIARDSARDSLNKFFRTGKARLCGVQRSSQTCRDTAKAGGSKLDRQEVLVAALRDFLESRNRLMESARSEESETAPKVIDGRGNLVMASSLFADYRECAGNLSQRSYACAVVFVSDQAAEVMNFLEKPLVTIRASRRTGLRHLCVWADL